MADTAAEFLSLIGACTVPGARWGDTGSGSGGTDSEGLRGTNGEGLGPACREEVETGAGAVGREGPE